MKYPDISSSLPPAYDDAIRPGPTSPPPPYPDTGGQLLVSRRLMVVLTVIIMMLLSLLVTLGVKHCQLYYSTVHRNQSQLILASSTALPGPRVPGWG